MTPSDLAKLTLFLAREVARLHGECAALRAVIQELRIIDPRLDAVGAAQVQIDALQQFYECLEKLNPELAFDTRADPDLPFPE